MDRETIITISPTTNEPVVTRQGPSDEELVSIPETAQKAFESFKFSSLAERQRVVSKALDLLRQRQDVLAEQLTEQMGRPISYGTKEIVTAAARGDFMLRVSSDVLKDTDGDAEKGFRRYIKKLPLGPVLVLFAWNV